MTIKISDLYGKKIITVGGDVLGNIKEIIINVEDLSVSHILLDKLEHLSKESDLREVLTKKSVLYKRIKEVGDVIIVSNK
ncbi:MAG: PRC-barrel domain-containing protein [Candidatus Micrarchaeia archaeon]